MDHHHDTVKNARTNAVSAVAAVPQKESRAISGREYASTVFSKSISALPVTAANNRFAPTDFIGVLIRANLNPIISLSANRSNDPLLFDEALREPFNNESDPDEEPMKATLVQFIESTIVIDFDIDTNVGDYRWFADKALQNDVDGNKEFLRIGLLEKRGIDA